MRKESNASNRESIDAIMSNEVRVEDDSSMKNDYGILADEAQLNSAKLRLGRNVRPNSSAIYSSNKQGSFRLNRGAFLDQQNLQMNMDYCTPEDSIGRNHTSQAQKPLIEKQQSVPDHRKELAAQESPHHSSVDIENMI